MSSWRCHTVNPTCILGQNEINPSFNMIFSRRNSPILDRIEKNSLGSMPVLDVDYDFFQKYTENFTNNWKYYNLNYFSKDINVVSQAFYDASVKAYPKLMELYNDIMAKDEEDFDINGTYFIGDMVFQLHYETKKGSDKVESSFYLFQRKGIPLATYEESYEKNVNNIWISNHYFNKENIEQTESGVKNWAYSKVCIVIMIYLFKKYANVETKIIPGESMIGKTKADKIINDFKSKITYLDSKWFTNIVKSDGFKVSGHFRLQPKKVDGSWTKEIIWIDDFEKTGYTSKAIISK